MTGQLYVTATPIGNLEDLSPRAVRILSEVKVIAAEDTRVSKILLAKFNIKTPLHSYHKFNEESKVVFFVSFLEKGEDVALISDAGVPCISDPGYRLVSKAHEIGAGVSPIPGASAVTSALSVSGFNIKEYLFVGFLPKKDNTKFLLQKLSACKCVVFFESPNRILQTLNKLLIESPELEVCLTNDLTKFYEKIYKGKIKDVMTDLSDNPSANKGEYTCIIYDTIDKVIEATTDISTEAKLFDIIIRQNVTPKEAGQILKEADNNLSRNQIYEALLNLKKYI